MEKAEKKRGKMNFVRASPLRENLAEDLSKRSFIKPRRLKMINQTESGQKMINQTESGQKMINQTEPITKKVSP